MVLLSDFSGVAATQHSANAFFDFLKCLPVATCCQSIPAFAIFSTGVGVPVTTAHLLDKRFSHSIAFNRKRVIGIHEESIFHALQIAAWMVRQSRCLRKIGDDLLTQGLPHEADAKCGGVVVGFCHL